MDEADRPGALLLPVKAVALASLPAARSDELPAPVGSRLATAVASARDGILKLLLSAENSAQLLRQ